MYKLMIAEDEPLARDAIVKMIDFSSQGFEVVAICEDGQQAADAYDEFSPDLVITDINMPFVSGLELADKIAQSGQGTQVIILTGYDDFNYARQAINSRVSNYILKPLTPSEFEAVLDQARRSLDIEADKRRQIAEAEHRLHVNKPLVRDQLLNRLLQGSIEGVDLDETLKPYFASPFDQVYLVGIVQIENLEESLQHLNIHAELAQFMISNVATELTADDENLLIFQLTDGRTAVLGSGVNGAELNQKCIQFGHELCDTILQVIAVKIVMSIGQPVTRISNIKDSFLTAQNGLDHGILLPGRVVLTPEDFLKQPQIIDLTSFEEDIILQVRLRDPAKLSKAIDQLIQAIVLSSFSKMDVQYEMNRIAGRLATFIHTESKGQQLLLEHWPGLISGAQTYTQLKSWLNDYGTKCIQILNAKRGSESQRLSTIACQYIQEHYSDSQLSLIEVCSHASVSLSHFSQLFKEDTGKTFVEYLTDIRMEKAQDLLRNSDKLLYAIAEDVGYENPAYFTVAFKKHVGSSPRDYRKQFGHGG